MLTRIEIFLGIAAVVLICILAGYAMVSGILLLYPSAPARDCMARTAAIAAQEHKQVSPQFLAAMCESVVRPTSNP